MNCESFLKLDHFEQTLYIGQLVHACQSDDDLFKLGENLIAIALDKGLFDRVKIYPDHQQNQTTNDTNKLPTQQREEK